MVTTALADPAAHACVLKRVGAVVLSVGLLDVLFMAYCFANGLSYASSLNVFAVAAGIGLIRDSLLAADVTWFFATFLACAFVAALLLWPLIFPVRLLWVSVRLAPWTI